MAIHNDEGPTEVSTVIDSAFRQNAIYCLESDTIAEKGYNMSSPSNLNEITEETLKRKVKKFKNNFQKTNQSGASRSSTECEANSPSITEMCEKDLLELRKVYKQCKSVIRKMEQKYGNLLDTSSSSDGSEGPSKKRLRLSPINESECRCAFNKKIVFDEDGQEVTIDTPVSKHICPSKLMFKNQEIMDNRTKNIKIEYSENSEMSDNVLELHYILKDPSIDITYRNRIIEKLKLIKQIHLNEIRFSKASLIEQLKKNPNEVFHFSGSNLSSISGYFI